MTTNIKIIKNNCHNNTNIISANRETSASNDLNTETLSSIFKLDIDCFFEVFDWLSFKDLVAIGQTCKRLQRIAAEFFQLNYKNKIARGENDGIYISMVPSNVFSEYIQKVTISGDRLGAYRFIGANCATSIKHFRVYGGLPDGGFKCVQNILKGVEFMEFNECMINGEFYEDYLQYCPNAQTISITRSERVRDKSVVIGSGNEWLFRKYANLENFELTDAYELGENELKSFFEGNPKIRTFATDSRTLWENRHAILNANTTFDTLAIDVYQSKIYRSDSQAISMIDCIYYLLIELNKRGIYQRLTYYMIFIDQQNIDKMLSLNAIDMVNGDFLSIERPMVGVKAFGVWCGDSIFNNIDDLPTFFPDVNRMVFLMIGQKNLLRLICDLPKLRQIHIKRSKMETNVQPIDLHTMNNYREKIFGAKKITIYVNEEVYLETKLRMKTTCTNMIYLKRFHALEWKELCARSKYHKSI